MLKFHPVGKLGCVAALAAALTLGARLTAATLQTVGPGTAVSSVDLTANFDALNATTVLHLESFTEGALKIFTSADSWAADFAMASTLDPFHGANGLDRTFYAISSGNNDWVTIQTTNLAVIYGVEFMYGNTWTTGNSQVPWGNPNAIAEWQTWKNGAMLSSGAVGPVPQLQMGTVLGFYDPAGFDQLLVRATIPSSGDPMLQALALDNLTVMLTNLPPLPVIYGSDFGVNPATGAASLAVYDTLLGCQYRLVYAESLAVPVWNPVIPPAPDGWTVGGGTLAFVDVGAVGRPQRFYRVEARPL